MGGSTPCGSGHAQAFFFFEASFTRRRSALCSFVKTFWPALMSRYQTSLRTGHRCPFFLWLALSNQTPVTFLLNFDHRGLLLRVRCFSRVAGGCVEDGSPEALANASNSDGFAMVLNAESQGGSCSDTVGVKHTRNRARGSLRG